jgi:hypothetical protein
VIDREARLSKNPQVVYRALEDESGVLLDLDSGQYHGVNSTGLAIWELLDGERTVADVVVELRADLDEPPPTLDEDVADFLSGLSTRGLAVG